MIVLTADVIHDPIDGYTAVIYCPECDGAFGVQTDEDTEVADEHVQACSGQVNGLEEIDELEDARAKARGMNAEQGRQDARDSWDHVR